MNPYPAVSTIAQTIQLSLSPIFMLAAIGQLLNVLVGRLARVVDRARVIEDLHPLSSGPEHDRHVWELRLLDRRMSVINRALVLAVSSGVMTCVVVALLFVAGLVKLHIGTVVAVIFIVAGQLPGGGADFAVGDSCSAGTARRIARFRIRTPSRPTARVSSGVVCSRPNTASHAFCLAALRSMRSRLRSACPRRRSIRAYSQTSHTNVPSVAPIMKTMSTFTNAPRDRRAEA